MSPSVKLIYCQTCTDADFGGLGVMPRTTRKHLNLNYMLGLSQFHGGYKTSRSWVFGTSIKIPSPFDAEILINPKYVSVKNTLLKLCITNIGILGNVII
jgi:hypothetical protein